jgi:putative FmdB family regulatory protein
MPLYDFTCLDCHERFDIYLPYSEYGKKPVACPACGSGRVKRRVPRVRMKKSEESRLESLADPSALAGLEDDPKSLGRMMRKMGNEMGEELPPEFDDVVDRLEAGQSPEEIESALPDLGGESGGMSDDL